MIAELRATAVPGPFPVWHRGSSVVVPEAEHGSAAPLHDLATPATAYRILLEAGRTLRDREDDDNRWPSIARRPAFSDQARADRSGDVLASVLAALRAASRSGAFKDAVVAALRGLGGRGQRRYSIATETYGRMRVDRGELARAIDAAVRAAFPRWRRSPKAGARLLCKADPEYAVLALQTATNLPADEGLRAGSLREHLAASLLTLAGAAPGCTVFDPFMGTGTILKVAARRFGAASCYGLEQSKQAFQIARQRLSDSRCRIFNARFEEFDLGWLPEGAWLVSNIPFGQRFARTPTPPLVELIESRAFGGRRVALLMSREQAGEVSAATRLRTRNVLVLGQPAAIAYRS